MEQHRDRTIDALRGWAILNMVFFTLLLKFGQGLPEILQHNQPGEFHFGDVVLPLFLFTSGLSLSYYFEKRKDLPERVALDKTLRRIAKLVLVGLCLSPYSAGGWFEMDEVMLSALLFLFCIPVSRLSWGYQISLLTGVTLSYGALELNGWTKLMEGHYLGGYASVPFYLIPMLAGLMMGQESVKGNYLTPANRLAVGLFGLLLIVAMFAYPVDKLTATPSYMFVSVLVCVFMLLTFQWLVKRYTFTELEYLGQKPLRYWILMFLLVLIPYKEHYDWTGERVRMDWPVALILSIAAMVGLWVVSKLLDQKMGNLERS